MDTIITDKSLCFTDEETVRNAAVKRIFENNVAAPRQITPQLRRAGAAALIDGYTSSLRKAGVRYFETDDMHVTALAVGRRCKGIIHRVKDREDAAFLNIIVNQLPSAVTDEILAYAVLPYELAHMADTINIPVILEVSSGFAGTGNLWDTLSAVANSICLDKFAALRVTGQFTGDAAQMDEAVKKYRRAYAVPLDFCPASDNGGGVELLQQAVAAYTAECDMLTLCYGGGGGSPAGGSACKYCALDEFLITMATTYHTLVSREYTLGLATAEDLGSLIGFKANENVAAFINHHKLPFRFIPTADVQPVQIRHLYTPAPPENKQYLIYSMDKKPGGRFSLAVDEKVENEIAKIIDDAIFKTMTDII